MTKSELSKKLAVRADIPAKQAEMVVNLIFDSMAETIARKDRVEIRGFGSLAAKHYPSYEGRNPRTGKVIHVKEKWMPTFKAGKDLRKRVDN